MSSAHLKWGWYALAFVGIVAVLSRLASQSSRQYPNAMIKMVRTSVSQANDQYTQSKQDGNALIALLHATQALNTAQVVQAVAPDDLVQRAAGIRMNELLYQLKTNFDRSMRQVVSTCPVLKPAKVYGVSGAWM
jgi:hypothetical protein